MRSPRLAAMGVATLSGLIPIFRDPMMTPIMIIPRTKEAMKAVATLLAHSRKACGMLKWPSGIQPKTTAAMDARKPTTVACTWIRAIFPVIIRQSSLGVSICPMLAAVDSLDARVISKFPLSPSSAGTRMKTSVTFWKTSQCCTMSSTMPAATVPKPASRKGNSTCSPMEKEVSLSGEGGAGPRSVLTSSLSLLWLPFSSRASSSRIPLALARDSITTTSTPSGPRNSEVPAKGSRPGPSEEQGEGVGPVPFGWWMSFGSGLEDMTGREERRGEFIYFSFSLRL